jgi:hypothetical protein
MLKLLTYIFMATTSVACVTPSQARRCPYRYDHSCDIHYQLEKRLACEEDAQSAECKKAKQDLVKHEKEKNE